MYKVLIRENLIKNLLVIILSIFAYKFIATAVGGVEMSQSSNLLSLISMLLVVVCFANFAFTYEKSRMNTFGLRLVSHLCTFLLLLLLVFLLFGLISAVKIFIPSLYILTIWFSALIYLTVVLYDFWDLLRFRE